MAQMLSAGGASSRMLPQHARSIKVHNQRSSPYGYLLLLPMSIFFHCISMWHVHDNMHHRIKLLCLLPHQKAAPSGVSVVICVKLITKNLQSFSVLVCTSTNTWEENSDNHQKI